MKLKLLRGILKKENLDDWKIKWNTGGGLCVYEHKEIWLGKKRNCVALFLHEVAHAICPKETRRDKTGHTAIWGNTFTRLVKKYMEAK